MSKNYAEWGMKWEPSIKQEGFQICPNCGCWLFGEARDNGIVWYHYIVGFSSVDPRPSGRNDIVGIFILDCPKCQTKFWQHCCRLNYESARRYCPNWPKDENIESL